MFYMYISIYPSNPNKSQFITLHRILPVPVQKSPNGIEEAGESTLSEIGSLYIVFSISKDFVSILLYKEDECLCPSVQGHALFLGVPGDAPAASERLLGRPRIPTLAERSPRNIWVESTRCGEPATRDEGASGK